MSIDKQPSVGLVESENEEEDKCKRCVMLLCLCSCSVGQPVSSSSTSLKRQSSVELVSQDWTDPDPKDMNLTNSDKQHTLEDIMATIAALSSQLKSCKDYVHECEKFVLEVTKASSAIDSLDPSAVDPSASMNISSYRARSMVCVEVGTAMLEGSPKKKACKLKEDEKDEDSP